MMFVEVGGDESDVFLMKLTQKAAAATRNTDAQTQLTITYILALASKELT